MAKQLPIKETLQMLETQTNGTVGKTSILDEPKARFEARIKSNKPAKPEEIKKALQEYCRVDDEIKALQDKIESLSAERTQKTKDLVALRGTGRMDTKSKGVGQITARGEAAWILFMAPTGDKVDF